MATSSEVRAGDGEDPEPRLTVAAVARRLGVAPSTLRTWDRRYGLGSSSHRAGDHRRYTAADLDRLVVMRRLTLEGVAPAEAARMVLSAPHPRVGLPVRGTARPPTVPPAPAGPLLPPGAVGLPIADPPPRRRPATAIPGTAAASGASAIPAARSGGAGTFTRQRPDRYAGPTPSPGLGPGRPDAEDRPGRCGGGRVFALPDAPQARGLARAAMALDNHETARILNDAIRTHGVVEAWTRLAVPVLQAVGERWRATGEAVDVEHLLSETLADVLRLAVARRPPPRRPSPVLLGCVEGDRHTLPLHALAAALAERGIGCRLLGGGMPPAALVMAVRRTGPALVFLYAGQPVEDVSGLADLPRQRPAPRLLVGGPGWSESCPAGARLVRSLGEAVEAVSAVLRG